MSSTGTLDVHAADSLHLLKEEATRRGCEELLDNFAPNVLLCIMKEQGQNVALGTLDALQRCVKAREALHDLEREMDKEYFVALVTGGYIQRSGVDCKTQSVATWMRGGDFFKPTWRIPMGSPRAKALVRAFVWFLEIPIVQNSFGPNTKCPTYYDFSMGLMEFNPVIFKAIVAVVKDIFPISNHGVLNAFGLHKAVPVVWNVFLRVYPEVLATMRLFDSFSDAVDMVTNEADIPDFWFSYEYDADKYRFKRTNTWCFERCLSDKNRVTTKDLYNPGPWPYAAGESVDVNSLTISANENAEGNVKRDARDTNGMDGLQGWFYRRQEIGAPLSRKQISGQLSLDVIEEDGTVSEDLEG